MSEGDPTYYEILGITPDASPEDVEQAYFDLARKYHPDVAGSAPDATARFMLINEAYQVLRVSDTRTEYNVEAGIDAPVPSGGEGGGEPGPEEAAAAAVATKKAEEPVGAPAGVQRLSPQLRKAIAHSDRLCRSGDFWQAYDSLMKLVSDYPRQASLRRALARAAEGKHRYREAAEHLQVACEVEYFNADNHALLGMMYLRGKQWNRAESCFIDALSWNDEHSLAKEGMKELTEHREAEKPLLQRLLGKLLSGVGGKKS